MTAVLLEADSLRKSFGAIRVIDGVSLRLEAGARHALIGPNGAGKTTLVGLLSGMLRPDGGSVRLLGRDVTRVSPERRVQLGLVRTFQINNLFRELTVLENVFLAVSQRRGAAGSMLAPAGGRKAILEEAERILESLGLAQLRHDRISRIAYGLQRLVEVAIALSLEPRVLLLDEPAAGLPERESSILLELIDRLAPDVAVLLIEHDMRVVRRFAKVVTVLAAGAVLHSGRPDEVMASADVRAVYLGRSGYERYAA